jgi:hypothetical protein
MVVVFLTLLLLLGGFRGLLQRTRYRTEGGDQRVTQRINTRPRRARLRYLQNLDVSLLPPTCYMSNIWAGSEDSDEFFDILRGEAPGVTRESFLQCTWREGVLNATGMKAIDHLIGAGCMNASTFKDMVFLSFDFIDWDFVDIMFD